MHIVNELLKTLANDMTRLYRYLLTGYEREVRPAVRHDRPIYVTFVFSLTQIIDVVGRSIID
ncbi:hypothetical protein ANCDUO_17575 [Ancylostoma duodenale]|uniref:Uncharacterized protein n=1 Tax=Ancylostoma duodenale TaxID=51022 RepID=A0A0C2G083_9BILA|nr:hypothetical protein ANCDUO_17575 [Ancylostoma duodenale]